MYGNIVRFGIGLAGGLLVWQVALADTPFMMDAGTFANQMAIPSMMGRLEKSHKTIFGESVEQSLGRSNDGAAKGRLPRPVSFAAVPGVPPARALVASYPPGQRARVEALFKELLSGYRKIEAQFGIPRNDVGGAVAAFIAGSYMAYRDVDFPDQNFQALVNQMRLALASNGAFAHTSDAQKQELYEQMAILGTYMALTRDGLKQRPDAQVARNLQRAAKSYLEQLLKTDADRVQLTKTGLVLR
ncbi:DUF6683 family protein [Pseudoduganella buxea]|uniref:Uncharacterized protein n=1 Tax=Pseudoduganella buxea TaxID=1949069 RepID=A0A6I3SVI8_9BURK|nr:DUF6683 family protein [Pseudoduganella buxea]MTV52705.1 hypothetical protein [Pseudoduganella buxea]GGC18789.1 hypothetical protein GCM10011572_45340 [Pseudoduganella buxea]